MDLGLGGKTALVTGGSKGIGRCVAQARSAEGARVMICARDADTLAGAAHGIEKATGGTVLTVAADLSDRDSVGRVAREAISRLGGLDILVNNAGAIKGGDFLSTPDDEWVNGWSLKLLGYIRVRGAAAHAGAPAGADRQRGRRRRAQPGSNLHDGRVRQCGADQLHEVTVRSGGQVRRAGHRRVARASEDR